MLVARAGGDPEAMAARDALRLGTRGGAACLGRDDLGSIEVGKRGDVALFDVEDLAHAGAGVDPVAALVFCAPRRVRDLFVEGEAVVRDGHLVDADEDLLASEARRVTRRIAERSPV